MALEGLGQDRLGARFFPAAFEDVGDRQGFIESVDGAPRLEVDVPELCVKHQVVRVAVQETQEMFNGLSGQLVLEIDIDFRQIDGTVDRSHRFWRRNRRRDFLGLFDPDLAWRRGRFE